MYEAKYVLKSFIQAEMYKILTTALFFNSMVLYCRSILYYLPEMKTTLEAPPEAKPLGYEIY